MCYDGQQPHIAQLGPCNGKPRTSALIVFTNNGADWAVNPEAADAGQVILGNGAGCVVRHMTMNVEGMVTYAPWLLDKVNGRYCRKINRDGNSALETDAKATIEFVRSAVGQDPIVVFGHGTGAKVVAGLGAEYLTQQGVKARILSRAAIDPSDPHHSGADIFDSTDMPTLILTDTKNLDEWEAEQLFICCYKDNDQKNLYIADKDGPASWYNREPNPKSYTYSIARFLQCFIKDKECKDKAKKGKGTIQVYSKQAWVDYWSGPSQHPRPYRCQESACTMYVPTPHPAEPTPSGPTPVEPTPAGPTPVEPTPAEPTPAEPTPAEPTPAEPTPTDPSAAPSFIDSLNAWLDKLAQQYGVPRNTIMFALIGGALVLVLILSK